MKKSHWVLGLIVAGAYVGLILPSSAVASATDSAVIDCGHCGDGEESDDEVLLADGDCDKEDGDEVLLADCGHCGDDEEGDDEVLLADCGHCGDQEESDDEALRA